MARLYSLRKSRGILHSHYSLFKKKGKKLSQDQLTSMEANLRELEQAVIDKDKEKADQLARKLETFIHAHLKKSLFEHVIEIGIAVLFALLIAIVVRQMWFELYQIPTGSMRPSFREQDHLTVTKTPFGLNVPLKARHFYFDPDLVRRTGVVVLSGGDLPISDSDSTYFGVIPYKKIYIKRLIGKPGDILYFYGGKIYGVDREGKPIEELLRDPWMEKLEHIPFITFEEDVTMPAQNQMVFHQMHLPIGRLFFSRLGTHRGEIFNGKQWIKDQPFETDQLRDQLRTYGDFWGIRNFAMARLLTREQLEKDMSQDLRHLEEDVLYLQLRHNPNLTYPPPHLFRAGRLMGIRIPTFETVIPLQEKHLAAIMDSMYTARFVIQDGRARRYQVGQKQFGANSPRFSDVPNGTYEFYYGKAEKVGLAGMTSPLPKDHPLYLRDPSRVKQLFNAGIEMDMNYDPDRPSQTHYPHRYAYFREGDLYLMGAPIIKKDDPVLIRFHEREQNKEKQATPSQPYLSFTDRGPPLKNGDFDVEFIRKFGLAIPEKHYLVLGDNHAMSADSRVFGFVPEENIQGTPSLLLWPPGERWLGVPQSSHPFITLPRLIIWGAFLLLVISWYVMRRKKMNKRLF